MKPVRVELAHRANYGVRRGKIEWIVMHTIRRTTAIPVCRTRGIFRKH